MSGRFKEFDRLFRGQTHPLVQQVHADELENADRFVTEWRLSVTSWDRDTVEFCVYDAPDAKDWQLFRTSLKGMTTKQKLYMLRIYWRWVQINSVAGEMIGEMSARNVCQCRIDNYIGALRRGGQLDKNYKVVK